MAVTFKEKAATQSVACAEPPAKSEKKSRSGQASRLPLDGIRFDIPQRLRTGHLLNLFQISYPQLFKMRRTGKIPEPAGYIGAGTRPTPYWTTEQIRPYIAGGTP